MKPHELKNRTEQWRKRMGEMKGDKKPNQKKEKMQ
jgi:hypothetical protein